MIRAMAPRKRAVSVREQLEAEHDKLVKQRDRLRAEIARTTERQARLLRLLSELPDVLSALKAGQRPANIDAETWADLQAFVAR